MQFRSTAISVITRNGDIIKFDIYIVQRHISNFLSVVQVTLPPDRIYTWPIYHYVCLAHDSDLILIARFCWKRLIARFGKEKTKLTRALMQDGYQHCFFNYQTVFFSYNKSQGTLIILLIIYYLNWMLFSCKKASLVGRGFEGTSRPSRAAHVNYSWDVINVKPIEKSLLHRRPIVPIGKGAVAPVPEPRLRF